MKNRIIYIDQLKTLAIFGVVCEHVSNISMGINGRVFWLFYLITMPMFFFSSGMFVRKKDNFPELLKYIARRGKMLLLPFLIIGGGKTLLMDHQNITRLFLEVDHCGYWFLLTLFLMDVILSLLIYMMRSKISCKLRLYILGSLTIIVFLLPKVPFLYPYKDILSLPLIGMYFPFFVFGYILNHVEGVKEMTDKVHCWYSIILPLALIGLYGVMIKGIHAIYLVWPTMIALTYIVYQIVKDISGKLTRFHLLSFVGQKSLYIYVFHYFFLPKSLSYLQPYIQDDMPLEIIIIFGYSVVIILLALLTERFIKQSNFVYKLLFGK